MKPEYVPFSYLSKVTKGKGCALDADIKSRLASLYEPTYSPTFPFTSALPISFNRPGLFGRGEKSNAKYRGTYAQIFHRVGLCLFFFCFFFVGGKLEGGEKKIQISGEPMPIFFLLFNVQSQAPPTLLLVLTKLMYVLDE